VSTDPNIIATYRDGFECVRLRHIEGTRYATLESHSQGAAKLVRRPQWEPLVTLPLHVWASIADDIAVHVKVERTQ